MSNLENTKIEEELREAIQEAFMNDDELIVKLAYATVEPGYKLELEEIEDYLVEVFWVYEFQAIDVRALVEKVYDIEF